MFLVMATQIKFDLGTEMNNAINQLLGAIIEMIFLEFH
jgi:hypothetical protein